MARAARGSFAPAASVIAIVEGIEAEPAVAVNIARYQPS
jgi:hypothetical protein